MRVKISMDRNGNKAVTIPGNEAGRGFGIQTNGNLPTIHQLPKGWHHLQIWGRDALLAYVIEYRSDKQKAVAIAAC